MQLYTDDKLFHGDEKENKNKTYRGYGQPVFAVADGVITEVKDGIPENIPDPTKRAVELTLERGALSHELDFRHEIVQIVLGTAAKDAVQRHYPIQCFDTMIQSITFAEDSAVEKELHL